MVGMPDKVILRQGTPGDLEWILDMFEQTTKDRGSELPFDREHVSVSLQQFAKFCLVLQEQENRIGVFMLGLKPYTYNRTLLAYDLFAYVVPERRGDYALMNRVVHHMEMWARGNGARELFLNTPLDVFKTADRLGRLKRWGKRIGFKFDSITYRKRL